jgi:methyltransferase (TIGR00027 family)
VDHIALRAGILDREVAQAVGEGLQQIVILGAGLDTRAHRLAALRDADVYELDFPSTQGEKQTAAASLPRLCRTLRYVPIDFERDEIGTRLASSDHNPAVPSLWLLEGVVPYLSLSAIERLLDQVSKASAQGSLLLLTYVPDGTLWMELAKPVLRVMLAIAGEPMQTPLSSSAMHELLTARGLRVLRDCDPDAWARELGARPQRRLVQYERLVVSQKT